MNVFQEQTLDIADNGRVEHLTYEGLLTFHQGEALWGASVGFRAMQAAGSSLSTERLWDRARILIVSAHPGPGVRDAIEYVTHCVSRNRFRLLDPTQPAGCHANMEFRWWVSDSSQCVEIELRHGFVPSIFFDLVDRLGSAREQPEDAIQLEALKAQLTTQLWREPLKKLFHMTPAVSPIPREMDQCTS